MLRDGKNVNKKFSEIEVGDVVILYEGDYCPADCVVLASSRPDGKVYVETSSLDGEKAYKVRVSDKQLLLKSQYQKELNNQWRFEAAFDLYCEPPNSDLFNFNGFIRMFSPQQRAFYGD